MKKYLALALLLLTSVAPGDGQFTVPLYHNGSTCNVPVLSTYAFFPTAGCSTSTACMTDTIAGNTAKQTTSGDLPTYSSTSGPNSTPGLTFNGTSDYLTLTTAIPAPTGSAQWTVAAIFTTSSFSLNQALFGNTSGGATLSYGARTSSVMGLVYPGITVVAADTTTMSTATPYAKIATYNASSNAFEFWSASGGTVTAGASGTATAETYSLNTNAIGTTNAANYLNGTLAALFYSNTSSVSTFVAQVASYAHCKFGI